MLTSRSSRPAALLVALSLLLVTAPHALADTAPRRGTWPLAPRPAVVRGFEPPASAWGPGHRGVDLAGRQGDEVLTALPGRVTHAGRLAGRGVVVVDHGGLRTTYEPVRALVSVGDVVGRGAAIGTLERAASHCPPRACLHWGLIRGTTYLDPLVLVGAGPVRLLPLVAGPARPAVTGWTTHSLAPTPPPAAPARLPRVV